MSAPGGGLSWLAVRTPPANLPAEQSLLGAILANPRAYAGVRDILEAQHFADPLNGRLYAEMGRRIDAGRTADAVALRTWMEADPAARDVGGVAYLAQLIAAMVSLITAPDYARAVVETWRRRQLIEAGEALVEAAYTQAADVTEAAYSAGAAVDAAVRAGVEGSRSVSLDEALAGAISDSEQAASGARVVGISVGMAGVDAALGGLDDGSFHVLAGRPGMGKSALGFQWAVHVARAQRQVMLDGGRHRMVVAISQEMPARALARRVLAAAAGVPLGVIKRGLQDHGQQLRLWTAQHELQGLPMLIEDGGGMSLGQIRQSIRQAVRRSRAGLIVVDHLHIVRPEAGDVRAGATWAVGQISNGLRALAREFECPVLALAQLNRGVEGREDKRPALADLRQAGEIEQDADSVGFLYRPEYYLPDSPPDGRADQSQAEYERAVRDWRERRARLRGVAELHFAKVRDGETVTVPLRFDGATTSFRAEPGPPPADDYDRQYGEGY